MCHSTVLVQQIHWTVDLSSSRRGPSVVVWSVTVTVFRMLQYCTVLYCVVLYSHHSTTTGVGSVALSLPRRSLISSTDGLNVFKAL